MPIDLSKLNVSDTSDIDDIVNELFSEESPKVNTQEPIKEVPGASVPSYQTKPEDVGFENVLDKKGFEQRYNVNPNVLSGRQTDPVREGIENLREKVGKKSNIGYEVPLGIIGGIASLSSPAIDVVSRIPWVKDAANKIIPDKIKSRINESEIAAATENELRGAERSSNLKGSAINQFGQAFYNGIKDEGSMLTFGLSEMDNNITLLHIAKKAEKEGFDNLPERERDLLTASALRIASEAVNSDEKTAMQIAGMSTAESMPYMLQFLITSPVASLATTPVRAAIKTAAEKAIKSGVNSKLASVIKGAARTAAVTTKATAMTAMQPTMYADAVSRGTGKATIDENNQYAGMEDAESAPVAAYKAFANATVENLSEHSGTMLSGATGAAARALKKVPALGGFISNVQKNNVLSGATKMMKAVGFNGAPEEFFEEQVSTGLNSLIVGDSQFSDFTNWKQQLATLISVGATAGAMTSTGSLMSVPYKKQIKNNYSEATDLVKDYFSPDEFDQFRASLSNMNIDSRPDFISSVAEAKGFSVDEVKDLTVFATRQAQYDGYVGSVTDKIEEEKIQAQNEINQVSNKDMGEVLEVNGFGENPVNIVGGFVVFDDEGYVDKNKSSQTIYYLDEEGKRKMASPDKFGQLISRKPLADAYAEALNSVEENVIIKEENDLTDEESPEQAQQDAVLLAENGNQVETPEGVGTISQVEQDENAAIVLFPDGRSKRFALPELKPAPVAQDVAPEVQTQSPIEEANPTLQTVESDVAPTQAAPVFPVDKENNIDYSQIQEPEMYAQALQSEFEGDAVSVIDEQIQSAQDRLEKAGKNSDAIKRRRAMKSEQAEVDRLNKVKAILTPSEQTENGIAKEMPESAEVSPEEESNMIDLSQLTEPERRMYVAENSTDPIELADLYNQVKEETEISNLLPWEAALLGRRVSKDSFIENSDKNNITGAIARSWIADKEKAKNTGLDVIASELSEYGVEVTPNDIVDFILSHPSNTPKKRSSVSMKVNKRFRDIAKELTGENVGGLDSTSGRLILAGLRAGVKKEQENQAMPFDGYTIPSSVINFIEAANIDLNDFSSFDEFSDMLEMELENGTFVFPLSPSDYQTLKNIINHGKTESRDFKGFSNRVEKARITRAIEPTVSKTAEAIGNGDQPQGESGVDQYGTGTAGALISKVIDEPTPEEIAEIESQLEKPKRSGSVIDIINEIAEEQNIRDKALSIEDVKDKLKDTQITDENEVQENKLSYKTKDGSQLNFSFSEDVRNGYEANTPSSGRDNVQQGEDPLLGKLYTELKEGEFCKIERIFTESKSFDFTAGNRIESYQDVAYIFKQLEDESVENSFAVLVKDGKPTIIHLGMGVYTSTQLNGTAILAAAERINPDKIYFVHNHPSGLLKASIPDRGVHEKLKSLFGDKLDDSIIINLKSGKFLTFNEEFDGEQVEYTSNSSYPVKVYAFNKQVFEAGYDPSENFKITGPEAVASFISGHRLGDRKKMNVMVLNQGGVVANLFTEYTTVTNENVEDVAKNVVSKATNYGGTAVIVYGDMGSVYNNATRQLKNLINKYSIGDISLLDFVSVEGNNFTSSANEGVMEKEQEYNSVKESEALFSDKNSEADKVESSAHIEKEANTLAESLNTPIRVVRDVNEITDQDKRKERRRRSGKGWHDINSGEIFIVLPNAESVGDVQATILHEIVGHKGLRGLLGDKFEEMMDKVFEHLPKATRMKIMESAVNKYRFDHRTATEEYLAEFVEKDVMEPSIWEKIKSGIKDFFRSIGVNLEMNDADIAYLLWKSKNRLLKGDGAIEVINKVAKGEEAKERFREAAYSEADVLSDELDKTAREAWERLSKDQRSVHEIVNETAEVRKGILKYVPTNENVKKSIYELTQGWFDNAVSLRILQRLVNTASDQPIESFANPYQFLTTIPARNENKMNTFVKTKFSKIGQAIKELGVPQSTVQVYAYLKHGLERNEYMRAQDVREKGEKLKEAADLRIQAIADSIEAMSRQLETADKKGTNRILAKIEGYNLAIEGIKAELESKKQEYEKSVSHKDYSGVYAVADLFIKKSDDREFTVAQIETAIEEFEKEHDVTKFWEAINGATKWTVQNEFEMGRISKDLRDRLFSMYEYYIPLKGWEEKNANEEWDYISGGGVPVSPIKKAGGRTSLASNLFENIGLSAQTSVMGGHKNLLKLHALRMVRNYPNPMYRVSEVWAVKEGDDWVPKAPEYSEDPEVYADNVVKFEEEVNELKGLGLANKLGGKLNVGRPITKYEAKEHEILVYENGKPYVIYINGNPDIARAINLTSKKPYEIGGEDATGKNTQKRAVNQTMRLMRFSGQNMTSRNPAFIAVNLMFDTQWAILAGTAKEGAAYARKMSGNIMSPSIHRSIMRGVRGKLDESNPIDKLFGEFQRAGGETGYSDLFKVDDFEKMIKDELNDGADWRKAYTWYTGPIDTLNRWAELTSRFSAYVTSRNSGRDIERSAYDAKEITLNFNRSGTGAFLGNWLKFAYLFAGAGLQGAYSISNLLLSKRSRKRITMIFAGTAMLGFLVPLINDLFLGGDDDDDLYSKKPDYERKSNMLIRIKGTNSFIKLPIAQSLRPFYNIGESMYQIVKGNRNPGEGTMDIIGGFGMLLPFDPFGGSSLMMSAFQPAYQIKENKDFFGRKIFKDDSFTQYDPEFKRAFSNTSPAFVELTRALNDVTGGDEVTKGWLNLNPGILEHLTEGYLGGAFKFVNDIGKQVNGAHEVYKGNPYPYDSRSYPIIGRFYTNTAATSDINAEYYKYVNDAEEISHRVKKYQDLGKKGDQESFDKSLELINSKEYQNAIFVNRMKSQIDDVKKIEKNAEGETLKMLKEQEKELKIMMLNEIEKIQ